MGKLLFTFVFVLSSLSFNLFAQKEEEILSFVEEEAEFPGGNGALMAFLVKNLTYPTDCIDKNIQGKVYVSFVIETNGKISNIKVDKSVHPSLDKEAVRVIKMMPKWKPGKMGGKKVRTRCRLPVNFALT